MRDLTQQQKRVLDFIRSYQQREEVMPSVRDIAGHFGFASPTAAVDHLKALQRKGFIEAVPRQARSLRLLSPLDSLRRQVVDIPIYGSIPAGFAREQQEEAVGCVSMDVRTLGVRSTGKLFALEVRGDSMKGKNILNGDLAVLDQGRSPAPGDVVAALIDNESTLKTFLMRRGKPLLRAENPRYPDLVPATDLSVQGVLIALVRKLARK